MYRLRKRCSIFLIIYQNIIFSKRTQHLEKQDLQFDILTHNYFPLLGTYYN